MIILGNTMNIDAITVDGKDLKTTIEILTYHNWGSHNSIYRGKNLGTAITAEQIQAIRKGTFADLYVGDYWTLPIDGTTTVRIMGFACTPGIDYKHAVVLLMNNNWQFSFNDTDTTEGHLYNSKMYNVHLPYILGKIKEVIPDEYIIKYPATGVSDVVNSSGDVSHYITVENLQIFLPSFAHITGDNKFESKAGYARFRHPQKWPLFNLWPTGFGARQPWLDNCISSTHWAHAAVYDLMYWGKPASSITQVCPYIILG